MSDFSHTTHDDSIHCWIKVLIKTAIRETVGAFTEMKPDDSIRDQLEEDLRNTEETSHAPTSALISVQLIHYMKSWDFLCDHNVQSGSKLSIYLYKRKTLTVVFFYIGLLGNTYRLQQYLNGKSHGLMLKDRYVWLLGLLSHDVAFADPSGSYHMSPF